MALITILLFFVIIYSIGLGLVIFAKESDNFLERNLMRLGIGLGGFVALGLLLNTLRMPLDYRVFLGIGIICILSWLLKNRSSFKSIRFKFRLTKTNIFIFGMLILFFITFFMYHKGAFSYPYLEDDDSWGHAVGVKYVSIEKTAFAGKFGARYIDPYPPAYDMLMGVLHQTNDSVYWTLKFFNALIISLSIIFFYFFAGTFTGSSKKALFSTFALFAIPAYLSHFIWSISITMPLFFVSFYAVEKIKDDKKWIAASAVVIAAALTSSPSHSTYFAAFFLLYLAGRILAGKKFLIYEAAAGFLGMILSLVLWWIPVILKHGVKGTLIGIGTGSVSILTIAGTADRVYTFSDFFFAKSVNMINNPIGIGVVLSILLMAFLVYLSFKLYSKSGSNIITILALFLIVNSIFIFALSRDYVKNPAKKGLEQLGMGMVPFMEFFSDQIYFILFLSFIVFLATALVVKLYKSDDSSGKYLVTVFLWFIFSFYAVNAAPYYLRLSPFRAWMVLAIPVALLCGESINLASNLASSIASKLAKSGTAVNISVLFVLSIIVYGIVVTSFVQKYAVNTAIWPPGGFWASNEEIQGYLWLKENIPANSKTFTFSNSALVIGFDKFICSWCSDIREYQLIGFNQSIDDNHAWLEKEQYKYFIIDGQSIRKFGINETNSKIHFLIGSDKFKPVFSNNGIIIFGVLK